MLKIKKNLFSRKIQISKWKLTSIIFFEDVRHERSLILLLSRVEPSVLKQAKFTDHEIEIIKNLALEKLHRQRLLKEHIALDVLEKTYF